MLEDRRSQSRSENLKSRYRDLDVLIYEDGTRTYEMREDIEIPESKNDRLHKVDISEENRLDLIADKYYNDATLWWIIAYANDIKDPLFVERGTVLRIPSRESVMGRDGVVY